jgi:hypothetical protein
VTRRFDAEACKLTPCRNPLGATTSRSQASAPQASSGADSPFAGQASELAGASVPQGVEPAQPAGPGSGAEPLRGEQSEPPSSLDTLDTTRRTRDESARRSKWLDDLGTATREHRELKARRLRERAKRIRARVRNEGASELEVAEQTKWHISRANGQEQRIDRVKNCGGETLVICCQQCDARHERPQGCRARHYCVRCRSAFARELRARFLLAREDVMKEASKKGLLRRLRRGGAYGDRFVTLTGPHLISDTVTERIERIIVAWSRFLRLMNDHLRSLGIRHVEWVRVMEWTPASDSLGHPHFHVWFFSPYVDQSLFKQWWREALICAGWESGIDSDVIVDVRSVDCPERGAAELVKYMTKDIDDNGDKIPPELYAQVIVALESHRQTQASKGFMKRAAERKLACVQCNSPLPKRVRRKPTGTMPATKAKDAKKP